MHAIVLRWNARHIYSDQRASEHGGLDRFACGADTLCALKWLPRRDTTVVTLLLIPEDDVVRNVGRVRLYECHDVMNSAAIAGTDLDRRDPRVLRETARDDQVAPLYRSPGRDGIRRRRHDLVRRDLPSFGPLHRRGRGVGHTEDGTLIHPTHECVDLVLSEASIVREASVLRIGKPRRHLLADHGRLDGSRPRTRALVAEKRHRRDLARPMASLTMLL